ncbi:FAD-dependent oxidoreductase [Xanthomonas axonopodis pv. begoniae]|uniref:NAD(P)/FAD-dependent oxidoreductase n=1 Tax=Xanthomonas phaseoli TaxID=1985254 RepID=UPI000CEED075|nr:FAD-dependent oxidoreductase [Xanthomonas phaseoli]MBO9740916.1 FAD-dependent oxidoreductase [Xanthomonas axonopodis pv. begoniae]MBO9770703.1 FAD-dependent oxidoreductase [Xanthomonas axonopodis pv. begoniae]MCC8470495.1 FAD-dependent oxidoreductase [Xanthomonas phaseoli]PPT35861.1 pyridine nucleotide-disulfide oxidoreductase [Xanthomonas axonopodis pv. begoniae]
MSGMVIVGAGQAGLQTAESLRSGGYAGSIVLLGDEPCAPYHRPPLSKGYLLGEVSDTQLSIRAPAALSRKDIQWRASARVMRLERATRTLHLDDGSTLGYTGLCLATGARARTLDVPGAALGHVCVLRSMADTRALAAILPNTSRVVVIGGGFIGLEFAAVARRLGKQVVVLEAADRLMARVVSPHLSDFFLRLHQDNGATIELRSNVSALSGSNGVVTAVHTADGRVFPADLVVVGIGVIPNGELAQQAGLACDRGALIVDECARSSDSHIVGAGDCTVRQRAGAGLLRLESVQNAIEQAKAAAASLLGEQRPYPVQPWFWSEQYEVRLQMAGLAAGHTQAVVRGDMATSRFSILYYAHDQLCAVDSINQPQDHLAARQLLELGRSPTPQQAADPDFALTKLIHAPA